MSRPRSLKSQGQSAVPIARYFAVVGCALVVLLLIAGSILPEPADHFPDRAEIIDGAKIRIESARKWPDKVVLDTSQPTFSSPSIDGAQPQERAERLPDETAGQTSVDVAADSLVKQGPDARPIVAHHSQERVRRKRARPAPSAHVARVHSPNRLQGSSQGCCWFDPVDERLASRVASRKRVARRDSWTDWHIPNAY